MYHLPPELITKMITFLRFIVRSNEREWMGVKEEAKRWRKYYTKNVNDNHNSHNNNYYYYILILDLVLIVIISLALLLTNTTTMIIIVI